MTRMMSRRPPSDGDSSRPAALPAACRSLGAQLSDARAARGLSVDDVAARLLFSRRQVLGLEQADPSAFYTHAYFLKALRKYLAHCDLPADALDEAPVPDPSPGELRLSLAGEPGPATAETPPNRAGAWRGLAAGVVLALTVGGSWWAATRGPTAVLPTRGSTPVPVDQAAPLPASPLLLAAAAPLPVTAEPVQPVQSGFESATGATVRISVGKPTWVFVRYPDNRVLERRLDAGEALEVSALPVYLAVGTADAVEVLIEDRPVALDPYIRSGQVRIGRSQLAALGARQ